MLCKYPGIPPHIHNITWFFTDIVLLFIYSNYSNLYMSLFFCIIVVKFERLSHSDNDYLPTFIHMLLCTILAYIGSCVHTMDLVVKNFA